MALLLLNGSFYCKQGMLLANMLGSLQGGHHLQKKPRIYDFLWSHENMPKAGSGRIFEICDISLKNMPTSHKVSLALFMHAWTINESRLPKKNGLDSM